MCTERCVLSTTAKICQLILKLLGNLKVHKYLICFFKEGRRHLLSVQVVTDYSCKYLMQHKTFDHIRFRWSFSYCFICCISVQYHPLSQVLLMGFCKGDATGYQMVPDSYRTTEMLHEVVVIEVKDYQKEKQIPEHSGFLH